MMFSLGFAICCCLFQLARVTLTHTRTHTQESLRASHGFDLLPHNCTCLCCGNVCALYLSLSLCLSVYLFYRCLQCKIVETLFLTESLRSPTQLKVALDFEPAERVCKETKKLKTKPQQQQQQ